MGTDGDWRGHIDGSGSVISPGAAYETLEIFEYKWNVVTGEFIISFGPAGNTEIANVVQISIWHPQRPDRNSAAWDETETAYTFTDLGLAEFVGDDVDKSCFSIEVQYETLIEYDMATYKTGTGV